MRWRIVQLRPGRRYRMRGARRLDGRDTVEYEHRVIVEAALGRKLRRDEHVHHLDGNGLNNDPANLRVLTASDHSRLTYEARRMALREAA